MREPASVRRQAPRNVASILDLARELGIRDAQVCEQQVLKCEFIERSLIEWNSTKWCRFAALLHESSLARTMPTDRILTYRCDTTLVGRGRSSN